MQVYCTNLLGRLRQKNCKTSLGYMVRPSVKVRVSEREERARKRGGRERGTVNNTKTLGYFPWEFSLFSHGLLSVSG